MNTIQVTEIKFFSSNLVQFHETESEFGHSFGRLVKFNNSLFVIGGGEWDRSSQSFILKATVEEFNETIWAEHHKMSPVNELSTLAYFSTLAIEDDLYIFG